MFDFKYIPDFHTKTDMANSEGTGLKHPGMERRNLKAFLVGCGILGIMGFCGCKVAIGLIRKIVSNLER